MDSVRPDAVSISSVCAGQPGDDQYIISLTEMRYSDPLSHVKALARNIVKPILPRYHLKIAVCLMPARSRHAASGPVQTRCHCRRFPTTAFQLPVWCKCSRSK